MKAACKVSFVIPCYNYGRFLPDCLDSIYRQEEQVDYEIVAIDDGSTDDTQAVLRRYASPRLRVLTQVNQGHARTINRALGEARGELIARIDPDDRYRPQFLNRVLPLFNQFPEVGLVYADSAIINEQGVMTVPQCDRHHGGRDFKGNELVALMEDNFICAPTLIGRREAWLACLPVPDHLAFHDWFFTLKMARRWEFYYLNEVLADYRVHANNLHSALVVRKEEEPSILWMLNEVFSSAELNEELERAKQLRRSRIYGSHYWTMANKYFGAGLNLDARRCYMQAIRYRPSYALTGECVRRLGATFNRRWYESAKDVLRTWFHPQSQGNMSR